MMMRADDTDVLIIGSGAGGAAAAWQLVRSGVRVVLLEKGRALPADGSTLDFQRVVRQGEFLSREEWVDGDGRLLRPEEHFNVGGKTRWYGAALLRFDAREFGADAAIGARGWPFPAAELDPWYATAERLFGVREFPVEPGLERITARLKRDPRWTSAVLPLALAPEIVEDRHEALHFDGFASARELKADADSALLRHLEGQPGYRLLAGADVVALEPRNGDPRVIGGVRLADGRRLRAAHTLLAAGALHSPRLLERYVRTHALGDLPGAALIGRHLKLHLLTAMVSIGTRRQDDLLRKTLLFLNDEFPHSSVQPLGFDGELIASLLPRLVPGQLARQIGARAYGFFLQTEDGSHPDNRVQDARDGRFPVLDYRTDRVEASEREHRQLCRRFGGALRRAGLISFTQRIGLSGTAHACGTLIAGSDPGTSVVDGDGRVRGLEGLHVVDGSVLPRSSRVNPSLTIYAFSLRAAARLAARMGDRAEPVAEIRRTAAGGAP